MMQITLDLVHHPLEGIAGIPQAEREAEKLKHPERRNHWCLRDILRGHWYLVVYPSVDPTKRKQLNQQFVR